jgi:glycosyltransferase involved in cell wall biosynthesis
VRAARDVVLLYGPPWFGPTQFSKHHLTRYLAGRGHRVLYVEAPLSPAGLVRGPRFVAELLRCMLPPRPVAERIWVQRPFAPVPYHAATRLTSRRAANQLGQRLLAPLLRGHLRRLRMPRPLLIAGLPHAVDVLDHLSWRALVYHCADDYSHVRGFPYTLPQLEEALCRRADLVVTTSETLCQARRAFNPNTHWISNGVEVEHFAQPAAPAADLARLPRPVIGFVGGLSQWVDIPLLVSLARARPAWSLALIGPGGTDLRPLHGLSNVHLLGPRPYRDVPGYLAGMDVGLIPFVQDPVTWHADPIKAYEYLAAGVPVVATDLPALRRLDKVVRLADTPDRFLEQVEAAVAAGRDAGRTERQAEAAHHSWTRRFERFEELLEPLVE